MADNNRGVQVTVCVGGGVAGLTAYQIAVKNGFVGTEKEWLASLGGTGGGGASEIDYNELANIPDTFAPSYHEHAALEVTGLGEVIRNIVVAKVDKVEGKGLSANDLTDLLLAKLNSLDNYDDTTTKKAITTLQSELDTLLNGDVDGVINAFKEIEAFLAGITDASTLTVLLADLKKEVIALIPTEQSDLFLNKQDKLTATSGVEIEGTNITATLRFAESATVATAGRSETAVVITLSNKDGAKYYPQTGSDAVFMKNGESVETAIKTVGDNIEEAINGVEMTNTISIETTPSLVATTGNTYEYNELTTLNIQFVAPTDLTRVNRVVVKFISGETATTVTMDETVVIKDKDFSTAPNNYCTLDFEYSWGKWVLFSQPINRV